MREPFALTPDELRRLAPAGRQSILAGIAAHSPLLDDYGLATNDLRLCHFLAQAAHETAGFKTLVEYGKTAYFRRRYGHRRDLGNRGPDDGARYRGRGIFQLTGRYNYRRFGKLIGVDLEANPRKAAEPEVSLRVAAEYWRSRKLNRYADANNIRAITKRINGGYYGLGDRKRYFRRAIAIWGEGGAGAALLRTGDRGLAVRLMQQRLVKRGHPLAVDGAFGRATRAALIAFQRKSGLSPDGIYGPATHKALAGIR